VTLEPKYRLVLSDGQEYLVRKVEDSSLGFLFLRISDFVLNEHKSLVIPGEEEKRKELENVSAMHISLYDVKRVIEFDQELEVTPRNILPLRPVEET